MKYFTISFLLSLNFGVLSYFRIEEVRENKLKEERINLLLEKMASHNNKMGEWIDLMRDESDPDYRQWMMERVIEEASQYSECKGVLKYLTRNRLP